MKNQNKLCFILCIMLLVFTGCYETKNYDWLSQDYYQIQKQGVGTKVRFYMWGGSTTINKWIDTYVAKQLKMRYNIKLERVPADANVFINKLLAEKQANKILGSIDIMWINGENFKNAMENELLFGPFTDKLPNYNKYVDKKSVEYDFGYPVNGFEVPYGRAQFVFEYDSAKIKNPPDSYKELLKWVKANPGRFTYPQPPDFTGSAFIRQIFYATTGGYEQYLGDYDKNLLNKNIGSMINYLNEMKPYLWEKGKNYPKDIATMDTLFERGEIDINMSYHQANAQSKILQGKYKETVKTFIMKDGSIYNTHYTAIPFNSPNKPGAIITANFLLSPVVQLSKNDPKNWGDFTVLDINKLDEKTKENFENIDLGEATLPVEELTKYAVPEISSEYLEILEDKWEEKILAE